MPIAAMGQYWLKKSHQEASSKKTPRITTKKYRNGLIRVIFCTAAGILEIGVVKPERMTDGTRNRKALTLTKK